MGEGGSVREVSYIITRPTRPTGPKLPGRRPHSTSLRGTLTKLGAKRNPRSYRTPASGQDRVWDCSTGSRYFSISSRGFRWRAYLPTLPQHLTIIHLSKPSRKRRWFHAPLSPLVLLHPPAPFPNPKPAEEGKIPLPACIYPSQHPSHEPLPRSNETKGKENRCNEGRKARRVVSPRPKPRLSKTAEKDKKWNDKSTKMKKKTCWNTNWHHPLFAWNGRLRTRRWVSTLSQEREKK